jgi:AcrR family transcriptional regulator
MLEEAAADLFLEKTYAGTTISQIAERAGVSRNTFFNYFSAKSDLLWVEIDHGLADLPGVLAAIPAELSVTEAVRAALLTVATGFGAAQVPWAWTQVELMVTGGELEASALSRFSTQAHVIGNFVSARRGLLARHDLVGQAFTVAVLAAAGMALASWARAGVSRGQLSPSVSIAISPVCAGFRDALDAG